MGKEKAVELFPMLKKEKLCGAIIYYDGMCFAFLFIHSICCYLFGVVAKLISSTQPCIRCADDQAPPTPSPRRGCLIIIIIIIITVLNTHFDKPV